MTVAFTLDDVIIPTDLGGTSRGLHGLLGIPEGEGPWPAIVIVHEAFGIDEMMRRQADRLASTGYIVLMPDLYTEGGARRCLTATFRSLMAGKGRAFQDIEAARLLLLNRPDTTGAIGVIGFCMGGAFALLSATRGFDVAGVNYGMLPADIDAALAGACPIIGSYGAKDSTLKGAAPKLEAALTRLGVDHEVYEYPNAGHAFLNEGPAGPRILHPLMRVSGIAPSPETAPEAWARIDAFFARHLA